MTAYEEVLDIIARSNVDDWEVVTTGAFGPTYHDRLSQVSNGKGEIWLEHEAHYGQAVYRSDVQLTLAWGMRIDDEELTFDWANFADPSVRRQIFDVFWNGALIHRFTGLVVDGHRVTLPFPEFAQEEGVPVEFFVEPEVTIFRLFHRLTGGGYNYDDYLGRTGLERR